MYTVVMIGYDWKLVIRIIQNIKVVSDERRTHGLTNPLRHSKKAKGWRWRPAPPIFDRNR